MDLVWFQFHVSESIYLCEIKCLFVENQAGSLFFYLIKVFFPILAIHDHDNDRLLLRVVLGLSLIHI